VAVFSNCDEVELYLNGALVSRSPKTESSLTQHLPHPPYFFELAEFVPGTLEAIGFIKGNRCAIHCVSTPGKAASLSLSVDDMGIFPDANESDVLIAHARILDSQGTLCIGEDAAITFSIDGASLLGSNTVDAEAGIASVVVHLPPESAGFTLRAAHEKNPSVSSTILAWERKRPERSPNLSAGLKSVSVPSQSLILFPDLT
jgi:beta-galactosidase